MKVTIGLKRSDIYRLDDAAQAYIADELHKEIRRRAIRYGVDEDDIIPAIIAANVMIENLDGRQLMGLFIPFEESDKPYSIIKVTLDADQRRIIQILVHEFARYLMRTWVPEHLFDRETVDSKLENILEIRQRIATLVHRRWG